MFAQLALRTSCPLTRVVLFGTAALFTAAAYVTYFRWTRSAAIRPNPWSWVIWGVTSVVEAATYDAISHDRWQGAVFYVSCACCFALALAVLGSGSVQRPTPIEWSCLVTAATGLVIWLFIGEPWWGHVTAVIALPVPFVPAVSEAWREPEHERKAPWLCWSLADAAALALVLDRYEGDARELPYVVVELACHLAMWLVLTWRGAALATARGGGSGLELRRTHLGNGVFATRSFARTQRMVQFRGPLLHRSEVPSSYAGEGDRYVQIGVDEFLGPSGGFDDWVNHSCEPNAGLEFTRDGIWLVALEDIARGDEVTWDYSTTLFENPWRMRCRCGKPSCRGVIGEFARLPHHVQARYAKRGVIPGYLRRFLERAARAGPGGESPLGRPSGRPCDSERQTELSAL